jgi:hypothetical protein
MPRTKMSRRTSRPPQGTLKVWASNRIVLISVGIAATHVKLTSCGYVRT